MPPKGTTKGTTRIPCGIIDEMGRQKGIGLVLKGTSRESKIEIK